MKQITQTTKRALILFALLATVAFVPNPARAERPAPGGPVLCGGPYGYSFGEPFWEGDVWSIQVSAACSDGTIEYGVGPVGPDGGIDEPIIWTGVD